MLIINRIKALNLIILFALINSSIFISLSPQGFSLLRVTIVGLLLVSVCLLFVFFIKNEEETFYIHQYFKLLLFLLFIWSGFTIFRSVSSSSIDLISLFGHYLMGWAWITPLAIVFGYNIFNWIEIFNFLGKLLLVGILLTIIFIPLTGDSYSFGIVEWLQFFPVILLTYSFQKPMYKKIVLLALISFLIVSFVNSQRINIIYIAITFSFVIIELLKSQSFNRGYKIILLSISLISILFLSIEVSNIYKTTMNNKDLSTDTRTFLVVELFKDMSKSELLIGRGALGTYYSPYFAYTQKHGLGGDSSTRIVSEVGYLQMVLKGGYIMTLLYIMILLPAMYLGIFKSKNSIARMCGYLILIYLVVWSLSYYPVYSAEYLLLWMAAGTAISRKARNITNDELIELTKKEYFERK